ncbi:MmpS family transport accessory protein [Mycobacterium sp. HNNTM2301]|uniref:MmpS family transport accessory protein n=1 Tax=Mycobacterium hainanense TaxID=3289775 RepID=UPI0035A5D917
MGTTLADLDRVRDYPDDDTDELYSSDSYPEGDYTWTGWPTELRWRPVTAIVGAVVAVGAIATAVIINSGDSDTTKATVAPAPQPVTSAPATTKSSVPPSAQPSPSSTSLPPETVTTVTTPSAAPSPAPTATPTAAPPLTLTPPPAALNPRTVVYSVTGTKQLLDLVNIVYTDGSGASQTEFNVSLPWTKAVILNPGVQTPSVVATSFYGRLNCSIVNAAGQLVAASTTNSSLATCAR